MRIKIIVASVLFAVCGSSALAEAVPTPSVPLQSSASASPPLRGVEEEVWHAVQDWAAAWSARDAYSFLAFYSKDFRPDDGSTFADWSARRRVYFRQIKLVEVMVAFPAIHLLDDKHAKVRFTQSVRMGQNQALDEKTMSLSKMGGLWMITEEQSLSSRIDPIADTKVAELPKSAPIIAPAAVSTSMLNSNSEEEVWGVVQAWVKAWTAKDAAAFIGYYGTRFRPNDGTSFDAWQKRRRDYFAKVKSINVDLTEQTIEFKGPGRADVRFTQAFQSDVFKETSRKMLTLERMGAAWKIVAEQADPRLAEYQLAKIEIAKAEAAKAEAAKAEAAKAEAAKAEAAKAEAAKAEAAKAEAAKAEAAKVEAAKAEAAKVEAANAEAANVQSIRTVDSASVGLEIWAAVQAWSHAWSSRDADAFIAHYGATFAPEDGSAKAAWEQRRREYFKRVKYIEVGIENPVINLKDETHAEVKFAQSFRSDVYRENAREKSLIMEKVSGQWMIMAEQSGVAASRLPEAAQADAAKAKAVADSQAAKANAEAARIEVAKAEAVKAEAAKAKADAEKARLEAARVKAEADAAKAETARAEASKAKADAAKAKAEADSQAAKANAEAARIEVAKAEAVKAEAAKAKADAAKAKLDAAKAKADADAEVARAKVEVAKAEQARVEAAKAEATKAKAEAARAKAEADAEAARSKAAEAKAAAQAAEVAKSDPQVVALTQSVTDFVTTWAKVWAARDIAGYLACYGESFQPAGGEDLAAWEAQRRARVGKAKAIEVAVEGLRVEALDESHAKAQFTQRYRSDNYRDVVSKTLMLEKTAQGWRIVREEAGAVSKSTTARH
ncbi:Multifunctional-autoprocessing repeats-in-toxin [Ferriphaselus amnicola]|uniref:Multifunctional-autoprocessing repeats-in-toxin n=1 Tax=Ferriphaselus amnicola TaxID=1188319 RepID=A0A2Z6GEP9_9PROT|nr:hypothetical protein [Ferriphaselus amnicola]BBE51910.1 Multifunctional-autoprocessing repeats-in-toxin [Ferriphaselus amnicola]